MNHSFRHKPVLLKESIKFLKIKKGKKYIDATLGGGGHTKKILELGGNVLGIDRDPEAIKRIENELSNYIKEGKLILSRGNFENLEDIAMENKFNQVSGIIFDLGMSSDQFESNRGFSFMKDEPLDMRMDPDLGVTAADLINALSPSELYGLFVRLAQVERARDITAAIVNRRKSGQIRTTKELVEIIESVPVHRRQKDLHPATKIFMALRIAVNNETENLERALPQAARLLEPGGRLAVISFHQGEDRIAKQFFRLYRFQVKPGMTEVNKKPIMASEKEVEFNPRSRSARLRIGEKI